MTLTLHCYDDADGKPPYNVPVLLELEGGAYRTTTWRWRRDPFEDEWDNHGQSVRERVLRWAHLPSGDPEKDRRRAERHIKTQVSKLTEQAAKAFTEQVRPAIEAALQAALAPTPDEDD